MKKEVQGHVQFSSRHIFVPAVSTWSCTKLIPIPLAKLEIKKARTLAPIA